MALLSVAVIAENPERMLLLKTLVEATGEAQPRITLPRCPVSAADSLFRQVLEDLPDIVLIDIPTRSPSSALSCIQLLRHELPKMAIFAIGELNQPETIIAAMRGGAQEFLDAGIDAGKMLDAFVRFTSSKRASRSRGSRGKVVMVLNAKGGSGGTTVAVNTALALQQEHGSAVLLDIACLGHAALHLNVKPSYTYIDALLNLHRLDSALLDSYIARCRSGLHLLAGLDAPGPAGVPESEFSKLIDHLADQYRYVVVDASSRLDRIVRVIGENSDTILLVLQTDVSSLWSASRIHDFFGEGICSDHVRLVINRYRKIPGFGDDEIEAATRLKIFWKIPNHYSVTANAIDRGIPVAQQNHSAIARSFVGLSSALGPKKPATKSGSWFSLGA